MRMPLRGLAHSSSIRAPRGAWSPSCSTERRKILAQAAHQAKLYRQAGDGIRARCRSAKVCLRSKEISVYVRISVSDAADRRFPPFSSSPTDTGPQAASSTRRESATSPAAAAARLNRAKAHHAVGDERLIFGLLGDRIEGSVPGWPAKVAHRRGGRRRSNPIPHGGESRR